MEQSSPLSLTAQHENLAQGTLLTTVKWPDLVPSWGRCWPGKVPYDPGQRMPFKPLYALFISMSYIIEGQDLKESRQRPGI